MNPFTKTIAIGLFAVISYDANALVTVNTSSGCKVRLHAPWPKSVKAQWVGTCNNGFASGSGKLILSAPEAPTVENSGNMDKGTRVGRWIEQRLTGDPNTRNVYVYSVSVIYADGKPKEESLHQTPPDAPPHIVEGLRREFAEDNQVTASAPVASGKGSQVGSAASNCPSEYSWPFSAGCGSKLRVLPNGHLSHNGCPEAGDPWKDEGPIGAAHDRRGLGWPGLDEFYECHLAARKGNSAPTNTSASSTKTQINVENAGEVNGRKEAGKSAWKRGDSQTSQSQSQQESDTDAQGSNGSPKSKYVSKDATHCVEMVPKGFKCDGPYDRFLTNICMTKISVRWRLGSDPWGMQELAPKGCTPVSPFRDQRGVQFKACSWDPKASHGPYSDPCRY